MSYDPLYKSTQPDQLPRWDSDLAKGIGSLTTEWLSTTEAAEVLSISENALRIMVYRDQIRAYKLGRRLRFKLGDCQALFKMKGA